MRIQAIALNSFALSVQEGRTERPLNILGAEMLAKLMSEDTDGAVAIFQQNVPPMAGPPLDRHSREDEWFYVLDGQITVQIDGQQIILRKGGSAFAPRGTAHTYQNFGSAPTGTLVLFTPGGFQRFFEQLTQLNPGLPAADLVRVQQLMHEYGVQLLGSPLS